MLCQKILDFMMHSKLVQQDSNEELALVLLTH